MKKKKRWFFLTACLCLCFATIAVGCRKKGGGAVSSESSALTGESFENSQSSGSFESLESSESSQSVVLSESSQSSELSEASESFEISESVESGGNPWSDENVDGGAWT